MPAPVSIPRPQDPPALARQRALANQLRSIKQSLPQPLPEPGPVAPTYIGSRRG